MTGPGAGRGPGAALRLPPAPALAHDHGTGTAGRPGRLAAGGGLGALLAGAAGLAALHGPRHGVLLLVGAGLGVVLHKTSFGFAAAFRAWVRDRDGRGLRAQCLMLALTTVLFVPMLASGHALGRAAAGAVAPASVPVLLGAALFAVGMQLGGG